MNFTRLVHTEEQITDDMFVLSFKVSQVYYVEDEMDTNLVVVVTTKPIHMFDIGQWEGQDDDANNYYDNEPFNLNFNEILIDVANNNFEYARNDILGTKV